MLIETEVRYYRIVKFHDELVEDGQSVNIWQLMHLVGTEIPIYKYKPKLDKKYITMLRIRDIGNLNKRTPVLTKAMVDKYPWYELAESIKTEGMKVPAIVEKLPNSDYYTTLEGKHRTFATTLIEPFDENYLIPCFVVERDFKYTKFMAGKDHINPLKENNGLEGGSDLEMLRIQVAAEYISQWISPDFLFTVEGFRHWGCLGWFGEYVLFSVSGDIVEIGIGESSIYLTALAKKYKRRIYHCDIREGWIPHHLQVKGYFLEDNCIVKADSISYPNKSATLFIGSSDDFFKKIKFTPIALAFIDGDHNYNQVKKDFYNVLPYVVDDGFILLHDTYPLNDEYAKESMCGTVYKLRQELEKDYEHFDCLTLTRGTAYGLGLTIVRKKSKDRIWYKQ